MSPQIPEGTPGRMKLPSPGVRELQPRVSQELGESVFLVLVVVSARVSGHMSLSLKRPGLEREIWEPTT